jgi:tRNA (guanine-N7-)-methyltransferase
MPHLHIKEFKKTTFPIQHGDVSFNFIAKNINHDDEVLISVTLEGEDFFLLVKQEDKKSLLKTDKLTRPASIHNVHKALLSYAEVAGLEVISSNVPQREKNVHLKEISALKQIGYFASEFPTDKEVRIEVGFGSGRHLLHQALKNPDILFIGLEIHRPSIEQVLKQIKIRNLKNLTLLDYDARLFLEFIPSNIVGKIFVHFPVPWDKKQNRRVIKTSFIKEALRTLKIDGTLEVRTDSENYFTHTTKIFLENNTLRMKINKNHNNDISSKYEDRWVKQEKNIYDIILYAEENSPNISINNNFSFEDIQIDKKRLQTLLNKKFLYDHSFIHIERIYEINQKHFLISLTLGSFEQPEHLFLELQNNTIVYYPHLPIPSKINQILHINLKEVLNG